MSTKFIKGERVSSGSVKVMDGFQKVLISRSVCTTTEQVMSRILLNLDVLYSIIKHLGAEVTSPILAFKSQHNRGSLIII